MSTRTTQLGAEYLFEVSNNTRETQLGAEYLFEVANNTRVTQLGAEYLYQELVQAHRLRGSLRDALINHIFRSTPLAKPPGMALALFAIPPSESSAGVEVAGNAYSRLAISSSDVNWNGPTTGNGQASNAVDFVFPTPTGTGWGIVSAWGLFDNVIGGNLLVYSTFSAGIAVPAASNPRFPAGALTVTFA